MKQSKNEGLIKLLGYLGIFILLMFIILPPLFRLVFPEELEFIEEEKKLIMNLNCVRTENFIEYKLITTIDTNYIDSKISKSTFTYEVEYIDGIFSGEEIIVEEYETLKRVNNIDFNESDNKYVLSIDYDRFDYTNEPLLLEHQKLIATQLSHYTNDYFECKTTRIQ